MQIQRKRYLDQLISKKDNSLVKVVTGLRRCGKTFLLKELYAQWLESNGVSKENIIYLALDKNENAKFRNPLILDEYLKNIIKKTNYLKNLFAKTYEDDIVTRYKIANKDDLGRILDFLASSTGSLINPTNISNQFGNNPKTSVSRNTVVSYIEDIKNSFLIEQASRFDVRGKKYVSGQSKYYFADLGLRNARLNFRQFDLPHLLENCVFNELKARGYSVDVGRVQIRKKNSNGDYAISYLESDFVINDSDKRMYIQVAEGLDEPEKKEQKMKSLLHIRDGFPKIILVNQNIPKYHTEDGIIIMSIQDFLLDTSRASTF